MFVNLLRTVADGPLPFADVLVRMRASLPLSAEPAQAQREAVGLLNALCALIAAAREEDGAGSVKPFLRVGLHLWVRELRRMVCRVALHSAGFLMCRQSNISIAKASLLASSDEFLNETRAGHQAQDVLNA